MKCTRDHCNAESNQSLMRCTQSTKISNASEPKTNTRTKRKREVGTEPSKNEVEKKQQMKDGESSARESVKVWQSFPIDANWYSERKSDKLAVAHAQSLL